MACHMCCGFGQTYHVSTHVLAFYTNPKFLILTILACWMAIAFQLLPPVIIVELRLRAAHVTYQQAGYRNMICGGSFIKREDTPAF